MNRRGFQISFAWLFAIIVGAVILFLAIYSATRVINLGQYEISSETQEKLGVLLNPLETGIETGSVTSLQLATETRIYNQCDKEGNFGRQVIRISQKNLGEWSRASQGSSFENKYILSENITQGENFHIFLKPFNYPYKVADLIYITSASQQYCFVNSPQNIEDELTNLRLDERNIEFADSIEDFEECSGDSVKVCFDVLGSCDINVNTGSETVEKNGDTMEYSGRTLMYGAIFSNKETYECQLDRLMKRTSELASLYKEKADFVARQECNSNLKNDLSQLQNSGELLGIRTKSLVNEIKEENELASCKLW